MKSNSKLRCTAALAFLCSVGIAGYTAAEPVETRGAAAPESAAVQTVKAGGKTLTQIMADGNTFKGDDPTGKNFRQRYDLDPVKVKENAEKVAADTAKLPAAWQKAPLVYYVVPPFSDLPRLPDGYPADGKAAGNVRLIATPGEFEAASLVVYPKANADKFTMKPGDLKSKDGKTIPAAEIDVKMLKTWYQAGSGWYGFFADGFARTLTPEMLLNDENMVRVDPATKDNYVRYSNRDGSTSYQWMSAHFMVTDYQFWNQANHALIEDAKEFQGVVLNKDEFKQFFLTLHVPAGTKPGVYSGSVALISDGKNIGSVPVSVRVLPFSLPEPKSNYDQNKGFYLSLYGTGTRNPKILKNMAEHNALTPLGFPNITPFCPEDFRQDIALAKEYGLSTRPIFGGATGVGLRSPENANVEDNNELRQLKRIINETADLAQKELGHTEFYSYAIDEGPPGAIRAERNAWRIAHEAGGKVMVTSYTWRELLFALDYLIIPGAPADRRIREVNKFHESNPDSLCGWYANPHSGPENPDYFRRLHGYQSYKSNYDVSANYCWYRNNWNDMAVPYEPNLRAIIMVYNGRDGIFDTIAWEGIREGMDDVKYVSYLKTLALEAAASEDGTVKLLGRRILSWLAYIDEERISMDTLRLETINNIMRLRTALKKGN